MRKYNDLIVSLIKAHRKYPGCESILDSIVEDVYKHAEVVLNTVTNESVITSYLNKIVSTSMITVPKKLGVNQKDESVSIAAQILAEPLPEPVVEVEEETADEPEIELTEADIEDNADEETLTLDEEVTADEPEMELTEADIEDNETEELSLEAEDSQDEEQDAVLDDESLANELSFTDESDEEPVEIDSDKLEEVVVETDSENVIVSDDLNSEPEVDKDLVDKMINGISEESFDIVEVAQDEVIDEGEVAVDDTNELLQETDDDLLELDLEGVEEFQEESLELNNDAVETESVDFAEQETISPEEEITEETTETGESAPCDLYKKFEFTPQDVESDDSEILSEIKALDAKQPDKNIYEICKLKYGENMSVSEVSSKLNIEEAAVIETLNDVIYEIKD